MPAVHAHAPLYAVDLDQRVVYWSAEAERLIAPVDDVVGRPCYEVLPGADPRNSPRCRPRCAVIELARQGEIHADFAVWSTLRGATPTRLDVSILLQPARQPEDTIVVHLMRCPQAEPPAAERPHDLSDTLLACLQPLARAGLTSRQRQILRLLATGKRPDEIAAELGLRRVTVRNHVQSAMERLGARTRLEAVLIAARSGLLDGDSVSTAASAGAGRPSSGGGRPVAARYDHEAGHMEREFAQGAATARP